MRTTTGRFSSTGQEGSSTNGISVSGRVIRFDSMGNEAFLLVGKVGPGRRNKGPRAGTGKFDSFSAEGASLRGEQ